eukprot:3680050-Prorocentrum_lima.AAC.1
MLGHGRFLAVLAAAPLRVANKKASARQRGPCHSPPAWPEEKVCAALRGPVTAAGAAALSWRRLAFAA